MISPTVRCGPSEHQLQTLDLIPLIRWDLNSKLCFLNIRKLLKFLFSVSAFQLLFSAKFTRISPYTHAVKFWKSSHRLGAMPSVVSSFPALIHPHQFLEPWSLTSDFSFWLELYLLCTGQTEEHYHVKSQLTMDFIQCVSVLESIISALVSACFQLIWRDIEIYLSKVYNCYWQET